LERTRIPDTWKENGDLSSYNQKPGHGNKGHKREVKIDYVGQ